MSWWFGVVVVVVIVIEFLGGGGIGKFIVFVVEIIVFRICEDGVEFFVWYFLYKFDKWKIFLL